MARPELYNWGGHRRSYVHLPQFRPNAFKYADFYKAVRFDGTDIWTGEVDWVDAIGHAIEVDEDLRTVPPRLCSQGVVHATKTLTGALHFTRQREGAPHRLLKLYGRPVVKDGNSIKYGFWEVNVIKEITDYRWCVRKLLTENEKRWNGRHVEPMGRSEAEGLLKHTAMVHAQIWTPELLAMFK